MPVDSSAAAKSPAGRCPALCHSRADAHFSLALLADDAVFTWGLGGDAALRPIL